MQELSINCNHIKTKRLSMVELKKENSEYFASSKRISRHKRNSSIEGQNKQSSLHHVQSNKSIGLTFNRTKSKKSMFDNSAKENKQSQQQLDQNSLKFSSFRPARKRNVKSKLSTLQNYSSQKDFAQLNLNSLEKELYNIMECPVHTSKTELILQQFIFLQKLGEGAFSQVYLALQKSIGTLYAMKVIKKQTILEQGNLSRLIHEIKIQSVCNHPNITKLYSIFSDSTSIYLLQQYAGKQTLYSVMTSQVHSNKMMLQNVTSYISQLCSAVSYLHHNSIIHRDIKPENILIAPGGVLKLVDFGWSVHNPSNALRKTFCGTPIYFSPELLSAQQYDQTVDIWAVGVLTYELLTGSNPFNIKCLQQLGKIVSEEVDLSKIKDYQAKDFVSQLLVKERVLRKSMSDVILHPFLTAKNKGSNYK